MVRHYSSVRARSRPVTGTYNPLQKLAYSVGVAADRRQPRHRLRALQAGAAVVARRRLGGFRLTRIWHFAAMCGLLAFIPGHLVMVALHGWRNFAGMWTGGRCSNSKLETQTMSARASPASNRSVSSCESEAPTLLEFCVLSYCGRAGRSGRSGRSCPASPAAPAVRPAALGTLGRSRGRVAAGRSTGSGRSRNSCSGRSPRAIASRTARSVERPAMKSRSRRLISRPRSSTSCGAESLAHRRGHDAGALAHRELRFPDVGEALGRARDRFAGQRRPVRPPASDGGARERRRRVTPLPSDSASSVTDASRAGPAAAGSNSRIS